MTELEKGSGVRLPLALFTLLSVAAVANGVASVLRSAGTPDAYASALGFAVITPILVYTLAVTTSLQTEPYRRDRGILGVGIDAVLTIVVAGVGAIVGTSLALLLISGGSWSESIGVVFAILAGRSAFVRRNRTYIDGDLLVGGKSEE